MGKKVSLGRGFESLIPTTLDTEIITDQQERVQNVLISDIIPNPDQPRRDFSQQELGELADSIRRHGVLQPIIIVRHGKQYKIVAGERRWRAAQIAEMKHIPAIVRSLEELEQIELALVENIQRVDLSPLEQALSIYTLQTQFNLALEDIAKKLGKAMSTVSNTARLLQLPDAAKDALKQGIISEGHARAILALKDYPAKQIELLNFITKNKWSVRQAEQFVLATRKGEKTDKAQKSVLSETPVTKKITKSIGYPVRVRRTAKGGQLVIDFKNEDDLKKISSILLK